MTSSSLRKSAEQEDFEVLYQQHSREVWAFVYARHLNADVALDITQETFLRLWREWRKGQTIANTRAWLLRVAHNLAEDHAKSAFSRNGTHPPQTMNGFASRERLPTEHLERQETFAQIRSVMEQLSSSDREILTLRYALDYSTAEIAQVLAINATAVHMRLSRARQRVADRLGLLEIRQIP